MKLINQKSIILIILIFLIVCISLYFFTKDDSYEVVSAEDFYTSSNSIAEVSIPTEIIIHITGEVIQPGIVTLPETARISDAVEAAGGTTTLADLSKVNLAYVLQDGQKVYIPSIYDEEIVVYVNNTPGNNVIPEEENSSNSLININTASASELETLSGIGPSTANKIIEYRNKNGKFKNIEDILNVSGIGEAKFNSIKDYICI